MRGGAGWGNTKVGLFFLDGKTVSATELLHSSISVHCGSQVEANRALGWAAPIRGGNSRISRVHRNTTEFGLSLRESPSPKEVRRNAEPLTASNCGSPAETDSLLEVQLDTNRWRRYATMAHRYSRNPYPSHWSRPPSPRPQGSACR